MRASRTGRSRPTPSTAGALARMVCARLRKEGLDCDPLLRRAGLSVAQIADRTARVSARSQIELLDLAAEALHDDLLGFHLACDFDFRDSGVIYYVLATSATVETALRQASRFSTILNESVALEMDAADEIVVAARYVDLDRRSDRHQMEFWMTGIVGMLRQASGRRLVPSRIALVHHRPSTPTEMRSYFGRKIDFGATGDELVFPASTKEVPIASSDPRLNELLIGLCQEIVARRASHRATTRTLVESAVTPLLPRGRVGPGEIARRLGMSERTLARRLDDEGTNFSTVLDELKAGLAKNHLAAGELPVSEVAALLGYRSASAFHHAFRRWTGMAPRDVRTGRRPATRPGRR